MQRFTATLVAEGSSDQALVPFIEFVLDAHCTIPHVTTFANDLPKGALSERIAQALRLHPCDLLFVHRDADRATVAEREQEIRDAALTAGKDLVVCVIPVRMTEAWLLFDEQAIRNAAGNPNGRQDLQLPEPARCESIPDPKEVLHRAIQVASELPGRRRAKLSVPERVHRVAHGIDDFSPLLGLPSFRALQEDVATFISGYSDLGN